MNLPKEIKFGHRDIEVRYDPELMPGRSILSTGHTDLGYIGVQSSLPEEVQAECVFRGVILAIADQCGLPANAEERDRMALGVLAIIRDNPGLLMVGIPESVRIFGYDWAVVPENEQYDFCGRSVHHEHALHMNIAYQGVVAWQILWHEILHVAWSNLSLCRSADEDERDVEVVSFFLCLVFTQNDFSWLLEDADEP